MDTEREGVRSLAVVSAKGFCMGAADAIPGVSGGTIALITGIYERLIDAITNLDVGRLRNLVAALASGDRGRIGAALLSLDAPFVVALGLGIVTALVTVASLVAQAVDSFPVPTFGFFFGLIAASAVILWRDVSLDTPVRVVAALLGFTVAFVASGGSGAGLGTGPVVTFLAGTVAVSAMILPGISGSLILLILGQYTYLTGSLREVRDGLLAIPFGGDPATVVEPATTAVVFCTGAVVGLLSIAHVVEWALEARREATLAFLVALVVGALRAPIARIDLAIGGAWTNGVLATVAGTALVGAVVVVVLERIAGGIDVRN